MTLKDWHQAQEADPVLSLVITRLRDGMLGKASPRQQTPLKSVNLGENETILYSKMVSCIDRPEQGN